MNRTKDEEALGMPPAPRPVTPPPPGGTYPPPGQGLDEPWHGEYTPPPVPQPEPPRKTRRIGRYTAALSLIAVGVALVAQIFISIQWDYLLRLTPLFLVFLGLEILLSTILDRDAKLKYDIFGIFISLTLIVGTTAVATIPQYFYAERDHSQTSNRLSSALEQRSYELLRDSDLPIDSLTWHVYSYGAFFTADMGIEDIRAEHNTQFQVYFSRLHDTPEDFAADCRRVLDVLSGLVPGLDYASFYDYAYDDITDKPHYSLRLDSIFQMDLSAAELADRLEVSYYTEDGWFGSTEDYEQFQREQQAQQNEVPTAANEPMYYEDGYYFYEDGRIEPEYEDMPSYEEYLQNQQEPMDEDDPENPSDLSE